MQDLTSSPPKSFFTPTAKARPDQAALATSAEARGATHTEHGLGVLPFHEIAISNIVWCMAYTRVVRNCRAIVLQ